MVLLSLRKTPQVHHKIPSDKNLGFRVFIDWMEVSIFQERIYTWSWENISIQWNPTFTLSENGKDQLLWK